ncbi:hypothetical protein, partial [Micrococcus sp. GbtcB5]|uniref:hypothetical protein n=1 Tax=Micrococcus sp. GbtcB5 TaxID=2824750 RepID=UPI001C2FA02C
MVGMWESQVRAEQGLRAGGIEEAFGSGDEGTQELGLCQRVPGGAPFRAQRRQAPLVLPVVVAVLVVALVVGL